MNHAQIEHYWQAYVASLPSTPGADEPYEAHSFGDYPALADALGRLILEGVKTATCSALWEWEAEGSALPTVETKTIVLDGNQTPLCVIETVEVTIRALSEVDAAFAYDEGEGDRTLESWRTGHWQYSRSHG